MGVTKTEIFTERQNRIADLAKAFSHPARVAILQLLIARKSRIGGDLVDELAQATVSQQCKALTRNQSCGPTPAEVSCCAPAPAIQKLDIGRFGWFGLPARFWMLLVKL